MTERWRRTTGDGQGLDLWLTQHTTRGREEDGELTTGTQHTHTRLTTNSGNKHAYLLCPVSFWERARASGATLNNNICYYFTFKIISFSPQLISRVSQLVSPLSQSVRCHSLNNDICYYMTTTIKSLLPLLISPVSRISRVLKLIS